MLRILAILGFLSFVAAPAAAVVVEPADSETVFSTITTAQSPSATITLTNPGSIEILQGLFIGSISTLILAGEEGVIESAAVLGNSFAVPTAFAGTIDLAPGTYLLSVASSVGGLATVSFAVSQVPLPGAVVLLGTALAGLAIARRRKIAAAAA